jgi:hypothetical protein
MPRERMGPFRVYGTEEELDLTRRCMNQNSFPWDVIDVSVTVRFLNEQDMPRLPAPLHGFAEGYALYVSRQVWIKRGMSRERTRYTLNHEWGHVPVDSHWLGWGQRKRIKRLIRPHMGDRDWSSNPYSSKPAEIHADRFAELFGGVESPMDEGALYTANIPNESRDVYRKLVLGDAAAMSMEEPLRKLRVVYRSALRNARDVIDDALEDNRWRK